MINTMGRQSEVTFWIACFWRLNQNKRGQNGLNIANKWEFYIKRNLKRDFHECIVDIEKHPVVQQMKKYPHHGNTNCYQHCLKVAYYNYLICNIFGLRAREAARAGMLHDLFLYDWHTHAKKTGAHFHGLTHPKTAMENAQKNFQLSEVEKDMVLKHMWPLTIIPPRYPESFVICLIDKYCCICEIIGHLIHR